MSRSLVIAVTDGSRVGDVRREAGLLTQELGFNQTEAGKVSIVATEAATNLVKHARGGEIVMRHLTEKGVNGLEILAIDKGPGMADVAKCLADGYSTAGSPGTGLGAISRLAAYFDIYSQPERGTVVLAQLWAKPVRRTTQPLVIGAVAAAVKDEEACGDAWSSRHEDSRTQVVVADGLGHGPLAARAADEALRVFHTGPMRPALELVHSMQGPLRSTRGASVAVAEIHHSSNTLRYVAVGNISGQIWNGDASRAMISHNGTVGHELHRVQEFTYPWSDSAMLVMHSDGLTSRWTLDSYPGLVQRHPSIIAAVLYRDFRRSRDDATALVGRDLRASA